jgi:hypothetical protein
MHRSIDKTKFSKQSKLSHFNNSIPQKPQVEKKIPVYKNNLIDEVEVAFGHFFKVNKIKIESLVPFPKQNQTKQSNDYIDKNRNPNISSFSESVARHKRSFKKEIPSKLLDLSNLIPLSKLLNSQNINSRIILEYETLLITCTQIGILSNNIDLLNHILSFFDCFQFFEEDFRVAWAFYALYMREFEEARNSFQNALKKNPDHWLALLGFGVIYLAGK